MNVGNGTVAAPAINFTNSTGTGFYRIGADNLGLAINGVKAWDVVAGSMTLTQDLLFTDATYDIGKSGATRPRDFFMSRNATIGGTLTLTGAATFNGAVTLGDAAADNITVTGTVTSNLIFTDATYDIGASGATRPRDFFLSRNATVGGTLTYGGVTLTAAVTGTGAMVLATTPTLVTPVIGAATGTSLALTSTLSTTGVGPHAIGGATDAGGQLRITGAFTGANALILDSTLTLGANATGTGFRNSLTIVEAGSGVHSLIAGSQFNLTITNGAATTTDAVNADVTTFAAATGTINATSLRVAAPTGATNNYAINVTSGDIYKAGTAYTNPAWVFEHFYTGKIEQFADRFGAQSYQGLPTLEETEKFTKEAYELPQMARFKKGGMFDRGDMLLASVEQSFLYLFDINRRLTKLEAKCLSCAQPMER